MKLLVLFINIWVKIPNPVTTSPSEHVKILHSQVVALYSSSGRFIVCTVCKTYVLIKALTSAGTLQASICPGLVFLLAVFSSWAFKALLHS